MKVTRKDIDAQNASITVSLIKEDYEPKFSEELKKYKAKAQMKGFRKGKTPMSVVKKMYGNSVLAEAVNEALQKALSDFIVEEKLDLLGQPLPSETENDIIDFDPDNLKDYEFSFDIAMAPDMEIKGVDPTDKYNFYKVVVDDDTLKKEMDSGRLRFGNQIHPESGIEEKDLILIKAVEKEGDGIKAGGWETGFTVMVELIADEKLKKEVLKLKKGGKFSFDIYNLEKNRDKAFVKKYLLNLDENEEREIGHFFEGTIEEITRTEMADLDQEFFDKYFGEGKVTSEAEAIEKIREEYDKHNDVQSESVMYREIMERLMEDNEIPLPEPFLKRWLKFSNDKISEEDIEKEFDGFGKNLQWNILKTKLSKRYDVEVKPEEVRETIASQVRSYFGAYGGDESYIQELVMKMIQDQNHVNKVFEELQANKIFVEIGKVVTRNEKKVSLEEFKNIVAEINKKAQPQK